MERPHIGIVYRENFDPKPFEDLESSLQHSDLRLLRQPLPPPGPMAGLEWLLPTVIFVYISKSYFNAFLSEAGKDHYYLVKSGIKTLASKFTSNSAPKVTRVYSKGKIDTSIPKYSTFYSVTAELSDQVSIKLLIQSDFTKDQVDRSIDEFLDFIQNINDRSIEPNIEKALAESNPIGGVLLVAYDLEKAQLEMIDPIPKEVRDKENNV